MAEQITIVLECDACGTRRQSQPHESIHVLRERLAIVGWFSDAAHDRDLCPQHFPIREA